jgi:hypothetical protein
MTSEDKKMPGYLFKKLSPGAFEVESPKGDTYRVDTAAGSCTCPDATYRKRECKHLKMARKQPRTTAELTALGGQYAPAELVSKRPGAATMSFEEK